MEDIVRIPLRILLAVLFIVPACNRTEPRSTQAAREERTDATEQMKNERNDYVKSIDARLAEFDQKFDGLDERAGTMTGAAKTDFKNAIDGLRDQRKSVAAKLDDLKKVSIESWTTLRGEVDAAMAGLDRSYTQVSETYNKIPGTSTTPKTKTY
jgi:DNA repair exonuclease SbcCD ATPase subunit